MLVAIKMNTKKSCIIPQQVKELTVHECYFTNDLKLCKTNKQKKCQYYPHGGPIICVTMAI